MRERITFENEIRISSLELDEEKEKFEPEKKRWSVKYRNWVFQTFGSFPQQVYNALRQNNWSEAIKDMAEESDILNDIKLTNLVYFYRQPEQIGKRLEAHEKREWRQIQNGLVRPALDQVGWITENELTHSDSIRFHNCAFLFPKRFSERKGQVTAIALAIISKADCLRRALRRKEILRELDIGRAIRLNRKYEQKWQKDRAKVLWELGFAITDEVPNARDFAEAVATWQLIEGGLTINGILGPKTWQRMEAACYSKGKSHRDSPSD